MKLLLSLVLIAVPAVAAESLFEGNVRVVINSRSTGGDTYQNASIVAQALARELGVHVKVDAVGTIVAFQELSRVSDGSTLMFAHDQAYLGHLYGRSGYVDIFSEFQLGPTVAINPGNAYLARKDATYNTVDEVIQACINGERVRVAIQAGGVSEIGFSALKNALFLRQPGAERSLIPIYTGAQAEKNQLLFEGQADLISGTIQANAQYTRLAAGNQKAMKFLWLTARRQTIEQLRQPFANPEQIEALLEPNLPVHAGDDAERFTFDKEFFFLYHRQMPEAKVAHLDRALQRIYARGDIEETQRRSFFIPNFMPSEEARAHLAAKASAYRTIIDGVKQSGGPSGPLAGPIAFERSHLFFPRMVTALLGVLGFLVVMKNRSGIVKWLGRLAGLEAGERSGAKRGILWATVVLTFLYLSAMYLIGRALPNTGLGFLISSIGYLFALSTLLGRPRGTRRLVFTAAHSLLAPALAWFVMVQLFGISLP